MGLGAKGETPEVLGRWVRMGCEPRRAQCGPVVLCVRVLTFQQGLGSRGCKGQSGWQQRFPGESHWPHPALQSPGWSLPWRWESGCENGCVLVHVNPQVPGLLSTVCLWPQGEKVPQGHRTV